MNDKKDKWVKRAMSLLAREYPSLNIIIYSNHKCTFDFGGSDHALRFDYDLSIAFGVDETYHILFSNNAGWFQRAGDGGYINWMWSEGGDFRWVRPRDKLVQFERK
ncbi:hypothetical protein B0T14DRAFT_513607 [Immersiella caudata]|uniref:Uncharacterized protein n=1 Tax=Immersiella caudata TaxID=314043 RepID=A0AA39X694_9PEZI|nr:hypothetical protein B0T14DRAFT_513607 [Immersiella caudata]